MTEASSLLEGLQQVAHDLIWTTWPDAEAIWSDLDPELWVAVNHNPVALLQEAHLDRAPAGWAARAETLIARRAAYHAAALPTDRGPSVAYFCMEFGLHESLPIYSGGLGVLAGDHLRSASDEGLDLVAVGLFYTRGYFQQVIHDGQQVAAYPVNDPGRLPLRPALDTDGAQLEVEVPHGRHRFHARVWEVTVGRVRLFLLDTDYDANPLEHRVLTRNLYGGNEETRIAQEVLLGVGGMRALDGLGIRPDVFHMNEGHSAFLVLELWGRGIHAGLGAQQAWADARERCVFTTHTPVPAGHDRFHWNVVDPALVGYREALGLPQGAFMDAGRIRPGDIHETLCMTVLALKGSRAANGVSRLHGEVSRDMWRRLPHRIGHITNGVHPTAWLGPDLAALFDAHLPGWTDHLRDRDFWTAAADIPTDAWLAARSAQRSRMVDAVRTRVGKPVLDPDQLTIGFARRFAPYKRGDLVFSDPDRLLAILDRGVQLVFAGKAHPADALGQAIVAEVVRWSRDPRFRGRVVFVPGYDMALGRLLTQGADVWLNNPRRPREASGTSGQKAAINGNLNLSILDGWWPEAWDGDNGWALGDDRDWADVTAQDAFDADHLYRTLETEVLPAFADPAEWARRMAHAVATCMPVFNTNRMVRDYLALLYRADGCQEQAGVDPAGVFAPDPRGEIQRRRAADQD
ncbi:MAG: alpha-glucan family phosphorylase [Alphaproteobacteria bacterium]|nr:alpha-glucan family phosphorylase [Alphaproteobacteria bacterium]